MSRVKPISCLYRTVQGRALRWDSLQSKSVPGKQILFLHNIYRSAYNLKYGNGAPSDPPPPPKVTTLEVYRRVDPAQATEIEKLPNRTVGKRQLTITCRIQIELLQDLHYYLNKEEGWIRFDSIAISANDHVAIYLRTESSQISRGEKQDTTLNLWTLKTEALIDSAAADTSRFYLMWRNVYQLSIPDFSNFTLKVVTTPVSGIGESVRVILIFPTYWVCL